ncbi:hypothetical protein K402DRAFT_138121 [Aulographum hederae CBS 113979]|uniref:Uncharacterized protein n=1 Tax=Aulographum hederae CBS 113979 TaxID=1176131 RepID=A0A6G1GUS0_9PEZI|nr:hypothetical protein K402DRAFT_138121 [Aulographum hederae CBS 113979]
MNALDVLIHQCLDASLQILCGRKYPACSSQLPAKDAQLPEPLDIQSQSQERRGLERKAYLENRRDMYPEPTRSSIKGVVPGYCGNDDPGAPRSAPFLMRYSGPFIFTPRNRDG